MKKSKDGENVSVLAISIGAREHAVLMDEFGNVLAKVTANEKRHKENIKLVFKASPKIKIIREPNEWIVQRNNKGEHHKVKPKS